MGLSTERTVSRAAGKVEAGFSDAEAALPESENFFSQAMVGKTGSFAGCCGRSRVSRRAVAWLKSKIFFWARAGFWKGSSGLPPKVGIQNSGNS